MSSGSGEGEVACLRATHRRVKERFVGLLAELVSRQAIGRVGRRAKAGRCGGEEQVLKDLPDDRNAGAVKDSPMRGVIRTSLGSDIDNFIL